MPCLQNESTKEALIAEIFMFSMIVAFRHPNANAAI